MCRRVPYNACKRLEYYEPCEIGKKCSKKLNVLTDSINAVTCKVKSQAICQKK